MGAILFFSVQTRIWSAPHFVTSVSETFAGNIQKYIGVSVNNFIVTRLDAKCRIVLYLYVKITVKRLKGQGISYHRLPNGPLKSVWLRNIHRENPRPLAHTFVCSAHLTEDCFQPGVEIIPGFKKVKTLISSAIPTIFKFGSRDNGKKARPSSMRQIQNRERPLY